jgi:IS5 family transposase
VGAGQLGIESSMARNESHHDTSVASINRTIAMVRARVEHPFRVLKRQFGYLKTRYRGLAKNRAQLFTLFALGNLFLVRRRLLS